MQLLRRGRLEALGRLLTLVGAWLVASLAVAQDDPPGRVGRVAALNGEVWVYEAEAGEWQAAVRNRPLVQGDRLSTAAASSVELHIGSTTLYLGASSELDAVRLDDEHLQFALTRGSLAWRVRSSEVAAEIEILTPEGRFAPQRAGLYRVDRQDDTSEASVWRGTLQFGAADLGVTLQAGERVEFRREGAPPVTVSRLLPGRSDEFGAAVLRDDQAAERSASTIYVSPEMTGVEDLDRYGRWQQHADYGALWVPAEVPVGWAPYRFGQWVWLAPWGWTWVDDAPWGFAPFHYGRWVWWGGRWAWAPGPRVARPVYAPALVAWIGGPQIGVVVGTRSTPAIGWVPLAPREPYRPVYRASPGYVERLNPGRPFWPAPAPANRGAPGAVSVLPAPRLVPRMPVAPNLWRADDPSLQQQLRHGRFDELPPGRPAFAPREPVAPRGAMPLPPGAATPPVALPVRPAVQPVKPTMPTVPPGTPTPPPTPAAPAPRPAQPAGPAVPSGTPSTSGLPPMPVAPAPAARPVQPVSPPTAPPVAPPAIPPRAAPPSTMPSPTRPVPTGPVAPAHPAAPGQPAARPGAGPASPQAGTGPFLGPSGEPTQRRSVHPPSGSNSPSSPPAAAPGPPRPDANPGATGRPGRQAPGNEAATPAARPDDPDPGQRRRTPDSRNPGRER